MFARAGRSTPHRKTSSISHLLTEAATAITSALSPKPTSGAVSSSASCSPAKLIESRSKLYKQLSELQNLKGGGILTEEEYHTETQSIMKLLKKLKSLLIVTLIHSISYLCFFMLELWNEQINFKPLLQ